MANVNHVQQVKEYYDEIGVEEMSIVEVVHMVGFAEWLERRRTLRAVDLAVCTCSTRAAANMLIIDKQCPVHSPNH